MELVSGASVQRRLSVSFAPQRLPYLALRYDGEVHNGGHFQYFTNLGLGGIREDHVRRTIEALDSLLASPQARVLEAALDKWCAVERRPSEDVQAFCDEALDGEFDDLDSAYYECSPRTVELLASDLKDHESDFILRE